ncbi:MAG: hypothetical protein RPU64_00590 [Candidatus Sedimenticola sp. (ex Thyasira tokunagai)]
MSINTQQKILSGAFGPLFKGVLLSGLLALAGCSSLEIKVVEDVSQARDGGSCHFSGLQKELNSSGKLHVVAVHGMGHHNPNWSCDMRQNIFKAVGLTSPADSLICKTDDNRKQTSGMGAISLELAYLSGTTERARFYELSYSDITLTHKKALNYDSGYDRYRVKVPQCLKTGCKGVGGLMNDNISDAFIYLGAANSEVQQSMAEALTYISNRVGENDHVIFIAESLGSRVTFDTLLGKGVIRSEAEANKLIEKSSQLWLLSNQLPLLQLGKKEKRSSLERLIDKRYEIDTARGQQGRGVEKPLQVVAFSDPNDLLTYPISRNLAQQHKNARFYNALINNNKYAYFGVVNPLKAHVGYRTNGKVMDAIASGASCSEGEK